MDNNNELEILLYDCYRLGKLSEEIAHRIDTLKAMCSIESINGVKRKYPNADAEKYLYHNEVKKRMEDLQYCFDELKNNLASMGKDIPLYNARELVKDCWGGDLFKRGE